MLSARFCATMLTRMPRCVQHNSELFGFVEAMPRNSLCLVNAHGSTGLLLSQFTQPTKYQGNLITYCTYIPIIWPLKLSSCLLE